MVTSEEIKRRLEAKRKGIEPPSGGKESSLEAETCPHCKTMNPPEAKFCVGCGEKLKEERLADVSTEPLKSESLETPKITTSNGTLSSKPEEYKICPSCKQKNKLEAKFCVICGNKFEEETGPEELLTPYQPTNEKEINSSPDAQEVDALGGGSAETGNINREMPEIRVTRPSLSRNAETTDQETEEIFPKTGAMISSKKEESDTSTKSEATPALSGMNDEKAAKVVPSVPPGKSETSGGRSENVDPVEKIRKAKELLDMGAITKEEFEQIKNKYLEQI
jgi:ribosomal protein L40E